MSQPEKANKKKSPIAIIVGVIVFALVSYGVKSMFKKDIASELKNAAKKVNLATPMMVDEYTQLDSAASVGKTNFNYYYTLNAIEKSTVDSDEMHQIIKEEIIKNIHESQDMKAFRVNNITLGFSYYDKNGELITTVNATPEEYK